MNAPQLGLMVWEIVGVSVLFLACFRLRALLGLVPVYTLLGVLFYTANFFASSIYIHVTPTLVVSPGSVAFFTAILFVVLAVYITEDALEARKLIYGLLATDIFVVALGWLTAQHLRLPGVINDYHLVPDLFTASPRVDIVSIIALFIDTVLIILLYELISRFTRFLFFRILFSTAITLVVDTVLFITGAYVENPEYLTFMSSAIIGKLVAAVLFSIMFVIYFEYFDTVELVEPEAARAMGSMFRTLTYRQKYELLQARSSRDPLTNVYNRGFFDETFKSQIATAVRARTTLTLLMIDIDNFKRVNDTRGHLEGDNVLQSVAHTLASGFRTSDYVCRYGGEEFVVLLPSTEMQNAIMLAEKTRKRIEALGTDGTLDMMITVTIGVAAFPGEAASEEDLLRLVDQRLYAGKNAGRNRVIAGI